MTFKIRTAQTSSEWKANLGKTILEEAISQWVPYPFSCKAGRCGACKSRLLKGVVEHLPSSRFMLSEDEKAAGVFLACRAEAKSDLEVTWLTSEDVPSRIETSARLVEIQKLTASVYRLLVKPQQELPFLAGQFAEVRFLECGPRNYSMANVPGDENLEFFIRIFPGGEVSNYLLERAKIGDVLFLKGPFGGSFLRKEETGPILAVGGSTGIAPILSILKESIRSGLKQKIYVYFGVRSKAEFFALETLIALQAANSNIAVRLVSVEDPKSDRFRHGQVGDVVLGEWKEFSRNWTAYVAGSPPMVDALVPAFKERGLMQVYTDPFTFGASEIMGKRSEAK